MPSLFEPLCFTTYLPTGFPNFYAFFVQSKTVKDRHRNESDFFINLVAVALPAGLEVLERDLEAIVLLVGFAAFESDVVAVCFAVFLLVLAVADLSAPFAAGLRVMVLPVV